MTETRNRSPRIKHVSWGQLEVEGRAEPYKDAKLFPGGSREWNWRDTGMAHRPGVQIADVQELLDHGAKIIVLSRGLSVWPQVPRVTLDYLKMAGVVVHALPIKEGDTHYEKVTESEVVGRLVHTMHLSQM